MSVRNIIVTSFLLCLWTNVLIEANHVKRNNGDLVGSRYDGVLATKHGAREAGACQLPEAKYADAIFPVALGDIQPLQDLKFQPGLCGHILRIDCGHGPRDIIVNNANLGGGLDLYGSSWDLATKGQPPGQAKYSVQLTNRNIACNVKAGTGAYQVGMRASGSVTLAKE